MARVGFIGTGEIASLMVQGLAGLAIISIIAAAIGYAASLGLWVIAPKPVQFYYHYFVPSMALLAALALALDELRARGWAWLSWGVLGGSLAVFAWFYPIISAAPLSGGKMSYEQWMWLPGWR